jgi:hypothetical protein
VQFVSLSALRFKSGEEEAGHSLVDDDPGAFQVELDALVANARVTFDTVGPERSGPGGLESSQDQLPGLDSGDLNQHSDST